jgi:leader peptidase (prepilin peptidase)/N-methyltransferase
MVTPSDRPAEEKHLGRRYLPAFAALFVVTAVPAFVAGIPPEVAAATVALGCFLIALSAIDVATYRLPDAGTLPLLLLGLGVMGAIGAEPLIWHIVGALAGYAVLAAVAVGYRRVRGTDGLGLGDAKMAAAGGAWVGPAGLPTVILVASVSALVILALAPSLRRNERIRIIPFGPFLALGIWYVWLYGPLG